MCKGNVESAEDRRSGKANIYLRRRLQRRVGRAENEINVLKNKVVPPCATPLVEKERTRVTYVT